MAFSRELRQIIESLSDWASNDSDVLHVWVYGSHAKGLATPGSDLDVAVEVITRDGETSDDVFDCSAEGWRSQLATRVAPYKLDLKRYDKSGRREKVRRAVNEHGILIYKRAT